LRIIWNNPGGSSSYTSTQHKLHINTSYTLHINTSYTLHINTTQVTHHDINTCCTSTQHMLHINTTHVAHTNTTQVTHQHNTSYASTQHKLRINTTQVTHQHNTSYTSTQHKLHINTTQVTHQHNTSYTSTQHKLHLNTTHPSYLLLQLLPLVLQLITKLHQGLRLLDLPFTPQLLDLFQEVSDLRIQHWNLLVLLWTVARCRLKTSIPNVKWLTGARRSLMSVKRLGRCIIKFICGFNKKNCSINS